MFDLLSSRIVVTQLVAILFAALAALKIALPATLTQSGAVAAILLTVAAVTAVLRFRQAGAPAEAKPWWQSRTLWAQIVAAGFAVLVLFGLAPPGVTEAGALELVMAAVGILTTVLQIGGAQRPIA